LTRRKEEGGVLGEQQMLEIDLGRLPKAWVICLGVLRFRSKVAWHS
jgi:hypothetical protein